MMIRSRILVFGALALAAAGSAVVLHGDAVARGRRGKPGTWKVVDRTMFTTDVAYRYALLNTSTGRFVVLPPPVSPDPLPSSPPVDAIAPPAGAGVAPPGTYDVSTVVLGDSNVPNYLTLLLDTSSGRSWFWKDASWHEFQSN